MGNVGFEEVAVEAQERAGPAEAVGAAAEHRAAVAVEAGTWLSVPGVAVDGAAVGVADAERAADVVVDAGEVAAVEERIGYVGPQVEPVPDSS